MPNPISTPTSNSVNLVFMSVVFILLFLVSLASITAANVTIRMFSLRGALFRVSVLVSSSLGLEGFCWGEPGVGQKRIREGL